MYQNQSLLQELVHSFFKTNFYDQRNAELLGIFRYLSPRYTEQTKCKSPPKVSQRRNLRKSISLLPAANDLAPPANALH